MWHRARVILTIIGVFSCLPVHGETLELIIELQHVIDGKPTKFVSLYANDIDPNSRARDDKFRLKIDGKTRKIPQDIMRQLDYQRRDYSYDSFTNSIVQKRTAVMCKMGGPAKGDILMVRYLTYRDHAIVKSEMCPVLSAPTNCLFTETIAPKARRAEVAAAKAMATLQTLRQIYAK